MESLGKKEPSTEELDALMSKRTQRLRAAWLETPPYFASRVVALAEERRRAEKVQHRWRSLAFGLGIALLLVVPWLGLRGPSPVGASVGQELVVWLDGSDVDRAQVSSVLVSLPEGVEFVSAEIPELASLSELKLAWDGIRGPRALPVLIRGKAPGVRTLRVRYLDSTDRELVSRGVSIRFLLEETKS